MQQRRDFIKTVIGGAGVLVHSARAASLPGLQPLAEFAMPLPIPESLEDDNKSFTITMQALTQRLHPSLAPTPLWGYNGKFLGPTFHVSSGDPIHVTWVNNLPSTHLFDYAIDDTIHGCEPGQPHVRTVIHLHGAKVLPQYDGYPESWFTNAATGVHAPNRRLYTYPNDQNATMLWYHDHGEVEFFKALTCGVNPRI